MATHSSILAWRIPRTEEPGGLQSMGLKRVGHDRVTNTHTLLLSWHVTHLREASRFCCHPIPGSPPSVSALFMSSGPWASYRQNCTLATVLPRGPSSEPGMWCLEHGSRGTMLWGLKWRDSISSSLILIIAWSVPLITTSSQHSPSLHPKSLLIMERNMLLIPSQSPWLLS